jgi:glycerol-3-phosphate acyltransferase PlsX
LTQVIRLAIDAMGGDYGPSVTVPAACRIIANYPQAHVILVGEQQLLEHCVPEALYSQHDMASRLSIIHTSETVDADDKPETVLRGGRASSMFVAVDCVRQGTADACVSAGNTGALLMAGRHLLKTLPGIRKPAIIASLPVRNLDQRCYLLDVGANIDSDAAQLYQYAVMGAVLANAVHGTARPRVGLLNIGTEDYKGTGDIRQAACMLADRDDIEYVGFIEGHRIFSGDVDVLVCDGFTGNITIKTSAGVVHMMEHLIADARARHPEGAKHAEQLFAEIGREIDPARYNGAVLLGLSGVIVKSHGHAGTEAFYCAIEQAIGAVAHQVPELITGKLV